jgi:hypothetical protein
MNAKDVFNTLSTLGIFESDCTTYKSIYSISVGAPSNNKIKFHIDTNEIILDGTDSHIYLIDCNDTDMSFVELVTYLYDTRHELND